MGLRVARRRSRWGLDGLFLDRRCRRRFHHRLIVSGLELYAAPRAGSRLTQRFQISLSAFVVGAGDLDKWQSLHLPAVRKGYFFFGTIGLLRSGVEFVRGFLIALEFCDVSNVIHREGISGVEAIRFTKISFGSLNIVMVERRNALEI